MTFELVNLIAIAFIAPVAFFVVINVVLFGTRGYRMAVKPAIPAAQGAAEATTVTAAAANDDGIREAA